MPRPRKPQLSENSGSQENFGELYLDTTPADPIEITASEKVMIETQRSDEAKLKKARDTLSAQLDPSKSDPTAKNFGDAIAVVLLES